MSDRVRNGSVMTVTGPVSAADIGVVMMHEHVLHDDVDTPSMFEPIAGALGERLADAPITMDILGTLWRYPLANRENVRFTRADGVAEELALLKAAGGSTVVEASTIGLHPDPEGLAQISHESGIYVVAGCGYFVDALLPDWFDTRSIEELAAGIVEDLRVGMSGTPIRAGIIGEVGTSPTITVREEKSLRASALAAIETGVAITVHLSHSVAPGADSHAADKPGFDVLRILDAEGMARDRVILDHLDEAQDIDYAESLINEGCIVGYDTFGTEWYWDNWKTWEPHDSRRVADVAELCRRGHHRSIVLSQDVAMKRHLHRFGGLGFDHLLRSIVPMLRDAGVSDSQLDHMLVQTPRRVLTT